MDLVDEQRPLSSHPFRSASSSAVPPVSRHSSVPYVEVPTLAEVRHLQHPRRRASAAIAQSAFIKHSQVPVKPFLVAFPGSSVDRAPVPLELADEFVAAVRIISGHRQLRLLIVLSSSSSSCQSDFKDMCFRCLQKRIVCYWPRDSSRKKVCHDCHNGKKRCRRLHGTLSFSRYHVVLCPHVRLLDIGIHTLGGDPRWEFNVEGYLEDLLHGSSLSSELSVQLSALESQIVLTSALLADLSLDSQRLQALVPLTTRLIGVVSALEEKHGHKPIPLTPKQKFFIPHLPTSRFGELVNAFAQPRSTHDIVKEFLLAT